MSGYRLGIDVGGTNTDAVVLDSNDAIVAKAKTPTTADVTGGILDALDTVLDESQVGTDDLESVMLGTTHCTNALTERRNLNVVGVIRVGAPATRSVPPLLEWPTDLVDVIGNQITILKGGHEFDGRELVELDDAAVREKVREFDEVDAIAVTSVFSPVKSSHEERVAAIVREELASDVPISLSHEIGSVGLLERENATALNASLTSVAEEAAEAFTAAMDRRGIDVPLYFGQNDGTLMSVDHAVEYPIYTVASGPSNSIRGAAYLSGVEDGIIVDVGGTTTDVGALSGGFPRESAVAVEIGEVETNFRMPDLISIGIGGGSLVHATGDGVSVGPESVGYELTTKARSFGGNVLTATDVEVGAGAADVGTVSPDVDRSTVEAARAHIRSQVEEAVDRMKTAPDPVPVVVVGGGSILVPEDLSGASTVFCPEHYEVANAVGVAIAQVSGDVDQIYSLDELSRDEAIEAARTEATENAVRAGARADSVDIVDIEEVPLSYLPGNAIRIKVKAAGELDQ